MATNHHTMLQQNIKISTPSVSSNSMPSPTHNIHRTPYFPNSLPKNTFIGDTEITFSNPSKYTKNRRKTGKIFFPNPTPKHFPNM